ncbi:MAG: class I adenylate-forming enzyme family protein [Candidatus Dormibacter sp.]|uniref:class I adenylate-forming enzyme family protein n=1 Tax=Candidatus Dormibacter sp. TaxID=2973982 RepID=UPI000DB0DFDF|nr:MAG: hypothetical protein DLM66_02645 [Candidatus Dormibacteraeota bacterium]
MAPTPFLPVTYLRARADAAPGAPAVIDPARTLTFAELEQRVHAAAAALRSQGLRPGDVVAVSLPNVWEYVVLELAIPLLAAIVMPIPINLGSRERNWALERSGARAQIDSALAEKLCVSPFRGWLEPPTADPDRVVEIALTSGTTGLPKLASLHAGLKQATADAFTGRLGVGGADRVLIMSPLMQGIGGMCLYGLRRGAALVMLREPGFDPDRALRVAEQTQATLLVGVPTNVIRLLDAPLLPEISLPAARCSAVAGAPMSPALARAWEERTGSKLCSFYGSMDAGQLAVGAPQDPAVKRWTTVGRIHDCAEAMITTEGEICMRGPTVQRRYWGEERGPLGPDGWAHMGDLGFIDSEGYLHVLGRLKDIVIRGGSNINPYEVEDLVRSHPAIKDVCVVGQPDRELGERLRAFVVAGQTLDLPEVQRHLSGLGVAKYKWPEFIEHLNELPLSGPGKVDRQALKARAAQAS